MRKLSKNNGLSLFCLVFRRSRFSRLRYDNIHPNMYSSGMNNKFLGEFIIPKGKPWVTIKILDNKCYTGILHFLTNDLIIVSFLPWFLLRLRMANLIATQIQNL